MKKKEIFATANFFCSTFAQNETKKGKQQQNFQENSKAFSFEQDSV